MQRNSGQTVNDPHQEGEKKDSRAQKTIGAADIWIERKTGTSAETFLTPPAPKIPNIETKQAQELIERSISEILEASKNFDSRASPNNPANLLNQPIKIEEFQSVVKNSITIKQWDQTTSTTRG